MSIVNFATPQIYHNVFTGRLQIISKTATADITPSNALENEKARTKYLADCLPSFPKAVQVSISVLDSPLCIAYYGKGKNRQHCVGCPVMAKTGDSECVGAPIGRYTTTHQQALDMMQEQIKFLETL